ncbi:MAG: hypothetical protein AABZ47_14650 [Planctomycetota bacterium]
MTTARKEQPILEEIELPPVVELDVVPEIPEIVPGIVSPEARGPTARKALGTKEVIPFQWKLIGKAEGLILTLFKSVAREDSDAQLDRVGKEGYYKELAVVDINAKPEKPNKKPVMKEKEVRRETASTSAQAVAASTSTTKKSGNPKFVATAASRGATKKAPSNSPDKSSKKKTSASAKSPAKRVAKKK